MLLITNNLQISFLDFVSDLITIYIDFFSYFRIKLIEDERLRMLKEHAVKLIGYLPRGVLRQDDLPHLGSEFLEKCNSGSEITPKLI